MPHVGSSNTEDLASSDEIKVFDDEGDDEKQAVADLTDLKSSLITESDQGKNSQAFSSKSASQQSSSHHQNGQRAESTSNFGKVFETPLGYPAFGYHLPHSPYHPNGTLGQMANKMAAAAAGVVGTPHSGSPLPFMMPNIEGFPQPPPAHMGHITSPVMRCETKANMNISMFMDIDLSGISRNLYNPLPGPQYPHTVLSDLTQQLQWNPTTMYQLQSAAFRGPPYPLPPSPAFPGFGRTSLMPPSLSGHPFPHPSFLPSTTPSNVSANSSLSNGSKGSLNGIANGSSSNSHLNGTSGECRIKQEHSPQPSNSSNRLSSVNSPSANNHHDSSNNNNPGVSNKNRSNNDFSDSNCSHKLPKSSPNSRSQSGSDRDSANQKGGNGHIKKPLNAFMIYMKEMRAKVIAESTLKESAAINQILGKRWHSLSRAEQEKYYDKARKERELHLELHPGWTAKDNYAINAKRKKKKRERNADGERGALKKCRARFGLDQQNHWCKPCRRKKKCIRYMEAQRALMGQDPRHDDDNLGSVGSVEAPTPDSKSTSESEHDALTSNDLSLSSPTTPSDYHTFMSAFNPFTPSGPCVNSPSNLHLNGHSNGHHHIPSPSLFSPYHHTSSSLNSLGSRMSSLLTPHSPLNSLSNFSSPSLLAPPIQAPPTPSPMPPRNSPFSIEQLVARPHCSQNRSSPSSKLNSSSHSKANGSVSVSVIQMPPITPPSSNDSATPMLSVA